MKNEVKTFFQENLLLNEPICMKMMIPLLNELPTKNHNNLTHPMLSCYPLSPS